MKSTKIIIFIAIFTIIVVCSILLLINSYSNKEIFIPLIILISASLAVSILFFISEFTRKFDISFDLSLNYRKEFDEKNTNDVSVEKEDFNMTNNVEKFVEQIKFKMQAQIEEKNIQRLSTEYFRIIADLTEMVQGEIYLLGVKQPDVLSLVSHYAYYNPDGKITDFKLDDGLIGQVASMGEMLILSNVPPNYIKVVSGLGKSTPQHLAIIALKKNDKIFGVVELASFKPFEDKYKETLQKVTDVFAEYLYDKYVDMLNIKRAANE